MQSRSCSSESEKSQDQLLRNSNIFKQEQQFNTRTCLKHPLKKVQSININFYQARYYVENDKNTLFCSKCALSMALLGLKIEETPSDQEIQRQQRIQEFENDLNKGIEQCKNKASDADNLIRENKKNYELEKDNCVTFFNNLIQIANQLRQTYLQKLSSQFGESLEHSQQIKTQLEQTEQQLQQFKSDIEKNHNNIVKNMEMKPFQDILTKYEKKVMEIMKLVNEYEVKDQKRIIKQIDESKLQQQLSQICYSLYFENVEDKNIYSEMTDKCITKIQNHIMNECNDELSRNSNSTYKQYYNIHAYLLCYNYIILYLIIFILLACLLQYYRNQNGIHSQSPMRLPPFPKLSTSISSQQVQTIGNSRRESNQNTPDSLKCSKQKNTNTPLDYKNLQSTIPKQQNQVKNENKYFTNDANPITNNLSQLSKQSQRDSTEKDDKTPKHFKQLSQAQTQLNISLNKNSNSQSAKKMQLHLQDQQQIQKNQRKNFQSTYDSSTPQNPLKMVDLSKKYENKRQLSKSKQGDQSKSEGKKQFIIQQNPPQEESTLKDRIFKELCSNPNESVYNQVLKFNTQKQKPAGRFIHSNKENSSNFGEWQNSFKGQKTTYLQFKK